MKKYPLIVFVSLCSLVLVSWGVVGHQTIGKIAENHLTPKARQAIEHYLGSESLAEISTFADEVRSKEEYKYTAPWHYINLPAGYDFGQFSNAVINMKEDNAYYALK